VLGQVRSVERVIPNTLLRHHEGHHLAVENAVIEANDRVHSNRNEIAGAGLEDRCAEGATGGALDIRARDGNRDFHAVFIRPAGLAPINDFGHPVGILYTHNGMSHGGRLSPSGVKRKAVILSAYLDTGRHATQN
jgi:hypothetical protein